MRFLQRTSQALATVILLASCAEQEMDSAEAGQAAHAPAVTPAAAPATHDSAAGHDMHGADSVSTTTSH